MKKIMGLFGMILFSLSIFGQDAKYISKDSDAPKLKIKPQKALYLADSLIHEHGTFVWKNDSNLETTIVLKGKFYFIKKSDFPAKTANWYTTAPAIRVNGKTGEIKLIKKRNSE